MHLSLSQSITWHSPSSACYFIYTFSFLLILSHKMLNAYFVNPYNPYKKALNKDDFCFLTF